MAKFRQDLPLILTASFLKRFIDVEEVIVFFFIFSNRYKLIKSLILFQKYIQKKTKNIFISVLVKRIQRLLHLRS